MNCTTIESCPAFQEVLESISDRNGDYADDATWILTSSFVILTMQSGFGLLEMGSSAYGHEINIMLKNVYDVVIGALAFFLLGYAISYGTPSIPFMGLGDFAPHIGSGQESGLLFSKYIFQFSFAATSTTIVSGCIAMRMRFYVYCVYSFYAVIVYAFVAHWVWAADGWLNDMGVHDFAGSGPVHLLGGMNGLVAILFLGPRLGRFDGKRPLSDFAPSSPTSILFGLFMLWWGWIGFNCGSSFGITEERWLVATRAAVTTINSTSGGGLMALFYTQCKTKGKYVLPDNVANGILGSLVGITASCACVHTYDALAIGAVGALVALISNDVIRRIKIDDPVGAVGVHAMSGIWGILSVGFFADGNLAGVDLDDGLFRGGGFRLLGVQLLAVVTIIGWSVVCATPFFYLVGVVVSRDWRNPRAGLRVSAEEEVRGADQYFHACSDMSLRHRDSVSNSHHESVVDSAFLERDTTTAEDTNSPAIRPSRKLLASSRHRPHRKHGGTLTFLGARRSHETDSTRRPGRHLRAMSSARRHGHSAVPHDAQGEARSVRFKISQEEDVAAENGPDTSNVASVRLKSLNDSDCGDEKKSVHESV